MNGGIEFCVYMTPCGYCSKFDKWCEKKKGKYNKSKIEFIGKNGYYICSCGAINKVGEKCVSCGEKINEEEFKNWKLNRGMF